MILLNWAHAQIQFSLIRPALEGAGLPYLLGVLNALDILGSPTLAIAESADIGRDFTGLFSSLPILGLGSISANQVFNEVFRGFLG